MDIVLEGACDKIRILNELSKCIRSIFIEALNSVNNAVCLTIDCPLIQCIDRSLYHGLNNLLHGYWPLVRSYSHTHTLQTIDKLVGLHTSHKAKGHAWLLATLIEGSLQSYLQCMLAESQTISRFYAPHAIVCDPSSVAQLSSLLTGLESINFCLEKTMDFTHSDHCSQSSDPHISGNVRPALELAFENGKSLFASTMTSSLTSSLASPGDSGFTQLDSETDTASFSEILLEADSSSIKEEVAVLPIDPCAEKSLKANHVMEPMITSDIANANMSSASVVFYSDDLHERDLDEIVHRKQKTTIGKQQKRVSFHECTAEMLSENENIDQNCTYEESGRLGVSIKPSASNLSCAVADLSAFQCEQEGVEIGKDSALLGSDGIEELSAKRISEISTSLRKSSKSTCAVYSVKSFLLGPINHRYVGIPVAERGIPEGQEDPPRRCTIVTGKTSVPTPNCLSANICERSRSSNNSSPAPSYSSLRPKISTPRKILCGPNASSTGFSSSCISSVLSQTPSKACLVNRFLRSITEKKISNRCSAAALREVEKKKSSVRSLNLYIVGVKPIDNLSQEIIGELKEELARAYYNPSPSCSSYFLVDFTLEVEKALHCRLQLSDTERILKILKVRDPAIDVSGRRLPFLAVVTNKSIYVVDNLMSKRSILLHSQLSSMLVGANSQWISMITKEKSSQLNLLIGENSCVSELISSVELSLRRDNKNFAQLPSVFQLLYEDLHKIPYWKPILQGEKVCHYSIVHAFEETLSPPSSLLQPKMKGVFMFRTCDSYASLSWEPGFFVLKTDVLYVFSDEEELSLHFSINLTGVDCCPIAFNSRPHTFKVGHIHVAAPDDSVAHSWIVALQKASLGVCHEKTSLDPNLNVLSGSLLLTESRLMLISSLGMPWECMEKPYELLLTAFVSDITALRVGDSSSLWCVVEFSCREVHESGGDFIIFFSTDSEMLAFRNNLWELSPPLTQSTSELFPTEPLRHRCIDISRTLSSGWDFVPPSII